MLLDVLKRISADTGLHVVQKRETILAHMGQAAEEMHKLLECNKMYREVTLVVPPNKVVTLPSFIGELRGMRMHTNELPFDLNAISQPRYVSTTLAHKFKNWRDLGESAIQLSMTEASQITLSIPNSNVETNEADIVYKIAGPTASSTYIEEDITLSNGSNSTTNIFTDVTSISSGDDRVFDVLATQTVDGTLLAVLGNNQTKTRYKWVDVSLIFWTLDTVDQGSLIDVLYKLPKTKLKNDTDSFYAGEDYDEPWYSMSMYQYLRNIQSRQQDAQGYRVAALAMIEAAKDSSEQGIMKRIQFGRNKFYGLFRKYRYFPGSVTNVDHNVQS